MPGFLIGGTGSPGDPNSIVEVRRTYRWVFQALGYAAADILVYLKSASRPSFSFDEPEMHHNQEKIYFAGKQTWEAISLTWYDVEQSPDVSAALWSWLNSVSNIATVCVQAPGAASQGPGYKNKLAYLAMLDGCGNADELWTIYNGWPQSVNWNALDYSSTDLQLIEAKLRYDRAIRS